MNNYLQRGDTLHLPAPYDCSSGDGALIGSIFAVAKSAVLSGVDGEFAIEGVFVLAKTTSQAWSRGDKLYWDPAVKKLTTDSTKGPIVGTCAVAALSADTTGAVRLNETAVGRAAVVSKENSPAPTSKSTAGAVTLTASEVLSGILVADTNGAGRTYTFPTAALLVAAVPNAAVGDLIRLKVVNGADAAETLTLAEGSGGGWDANQTSSSRVIPQNASKDVLIRLTNITASSEAYVMYA